jgi:protein-S-isoprenylcysteine O-methyltransferase Ste14
MLRVPPPIWVLFYLLLTAGLSWIMGWPRGLHSAPIGVALVVLGLIPAVWGRIMFLRAGTEVQPTSPGNTALVTGGPFGLTRNPMYLGLVIVCLGVAIWVGAWPMLLAPLGLFATSNFVHIPFEEAKMRRQFGEAFDAYCARVRRWL